MDIIKLLPFNAVIFGVVCNTVIEHQNEGRKAICTSFILLIQETHQSLSNYDSCPKARYFGSGTQPTSMKWELDWESLVLALILTCLLNLSKSVPQFDSKSSSKSLDHWVMCCTSFVGLSRYAFSLCTLPFPRRLTCIGLFIFWFPVGFGLWGALAGDWRKGREWSYMFIFLNPSLYYLLSWPCPSVEFKRVL